MDIEIPRHDWEHILHGFTAQHKGCLTRVYEESTGSPPAFSSDFWPLNAVAYEDRGGEKVVSIVVERLGDPPATHVVAEPAELHIKRTDGDDADAGLEIISRDGTLTVIMLRMPEA